jgi:hypothetical protein
MNSNSLIQKAKDFFFGGNDNGGYGVHNAEYEKITDTTVKEKMREITGIGEGSATLLFPVWNNTTKAIEFINQADFITAITPEGQ